MFCLFQNPGRDAGECGDMQAVAAVGRSRLERVQEDDPVAIFHGIQMHIGDGRQCLRKPRQLKIVGGEQGKCANASREIGSAGPGERQTVIGAGATADLVHQHQALRGRVMQDIRRFCHLNHERRAPAGEIIRGPDARKDPVYRSDYGALRGNETADVGQQHDECRLTHVGRLATHIGTGDDEHALVITKAYVIGYERILDDALDDGVASRDDFDARRFGQFGTPQIEAVGTFGECRQHIQFGERLCATLQVGEVVQQACE